MEIKNFNREELSPSVLQVLDLVKQEFTKCENKLQLVNTLYMMKKEDKGNLFLVQSSQDKMLHLLQPITKNEIITNGGTFETPTIIGEIEFDLPNSEFFDKRVVIGGITDSDDLMFLFRLSMNVDLFFAFAITLEQFSKIQLRYIKEGKIETVQEFKKQVQKINPDKTIFLGCVDKTIIDKIMQLFADDKDVFIAVMSHEVLKASLDSLSYEALDEEHKNAIQKTKASAKNKEKALEIALEMKKWIGDATFTIPTLKMYYNTTRSRHTRGKRNNLNMTNKDIVEIIDFLITMGHIVDVTPAEAKNHKKLFMVVIEDTDMLKVFTKETDILKHEIETLTHLKSIVDEQLVELSAKIEKDFNKEISEEVKPEYNDSTIRETNPANVEGRAEFNDMNSRSIDNSDSEPETATDHINDRN